MTNMYEKLLFKGVTVNSHAKRNPIKTGLKYKKTAFTKIKLTQETLN